MDSFNLESDPQSRGDPVMSPDASRSSSSLPLRVPGDRRNKELGGIIQSQFDEMDAARRGGSRPGALNVHAAEFVPCAPREIELPEIERREPNTRARHLVDSRRREPQHARAAPG